MKVDGHGVFQCEALARLAHEGQIRWNGDPYITHCAAVADGVEGYRQKMAAWLHDVVEDCPGWPAARLREEGVPKAVLSDVWWLTKRTGYYEYITELITQSPIAVQVKLSDLAHNMSDLQSGKRRDMYLFAEQFLQNYDPNQLRNR